MWKIWFRGSMTYHKFLEFDLAFTMGNGRAFVSHNKFHRFFEKVTEEPFLWSASFRRKLAIFL
jgi:hypothetical protein